MTDKEPFWYIKNLAISLNKKKSTDWVEDAFLYQKGHKENLGKNINYNRLYFYFISIILIFLLLAGRLFFLQIYKGEEYRALADENRIRKEVLKTNRGLFKDRYYRNLVYNRPYFNVFLIPINLPENKENYDYLLNNLAEYLSLSKKDIIQKLEEISSHDSRYYKPQLIKEAVSLDELWKIYILAKEYPAIYIEEDSYREYISNDKDNTLSLSHLLGYESKISKEDLEKYKELNYLLTDQIGKAGLEKEYELFLKGKHGKRYWEVDALLRPQKILYEEEKIPGDDIILTIDLDYQRKLEEIVKKYLKEQNLTKGGAILMNPNNGDILALVSLPSYNDNDFARGISQEKYSSLLNDKNHPLLNRMISGVYPPGSTFKLIVGAAALEEGIVTDKTTVLSTGGLKIKDWFFPDWKAGGHGITDIYKAIAQSVNTYFYMVGGGYKDFKGLGVYRLYQYADKFNLGHKLGIDLPNEASGFVPSPEWKKQVKHEEWYIGDTYHFAIGQGDLLVTPLQVAEWTAFFANGGKLYVPHLLKERHNERLNIHEKYIPVLLRDNIISDKNVEIIKKALRQTVLSGSGQALKYLPVSVAGKTGTAQWNLDKKPHAWWTCFAPYENPEIVLTVFVEEGEEGTKISVPIAKEFLEWWSRVRLEKKKAVEIE